MPTCKSLKHVLKSAERSSSRSFSSIAKHILHRRLKRLVAENKESQIVITSENFIQKLIIHFL